MILRMVLFLCLFLSNFKVFERLCIFFCFDCAAYAKRSPECWVSGSGCAGGSGEPIHRQASTSPPRLSGEASAPVPTSPSSSNASVRKKMVSATLAFT